MKIWWGSVRYIPGC